MTLLTFMILKLRAGHSQHLSRQQDKRDGHSQQLLRQQDNVLMSKHCRLVPCRCYTLWQLSFDTKGLKLSVFCMSLKPPGWKLARAQIWTFLNIFYPKTYGHYLTKSIKKDLVVDRKMYFFKINFCFPVIPGWNRAASRPAGGVHALVEKTIKTRT